MSRRYKNIFFDLDDTLWAFSENAYDTFQEMYHKYAYDRFFSSFDHFYQLYQKRNVELWEEYGQGKITKDELNRQRFLYPLEQVGWGDAELAKRFSDDFFSVIPTKAKIDGYFRKVVLSDDIGVLKPHAPIFHFALSATQSYLEDSLMVGDNWENDVAGAYGVGMHQAFFDVEGRSELPFKPTYHIKDLKELLTFL